MVSDYMFKMFLGDNIADDSVTRETVYGTKFYTKLNTDKTAWTEIAKAAVEYGYKSVLIELADGVKYKSHPEIAIEGAWEVEELKEELQKLRDMGLTVYPKLNFSTAHDAWLGLYSRMVSTDEYYALVRDLISEVIDIFDKPEMFHFGLEDEGHHAQRRYDYVCFRQHDLYWHDYKFFLDCIREQGVRPWVAFDPYLVNEEKFLEYTDKDVVISPSYDGNFFSGTTPIIPNPQTVSGKMLESFSKLQNLGYEVIPTFIQKNTRVAVSQFVKYMNNVISSDKVKAMLVSPELSTTHSKKFSFCETFIGVSEATKAL